MESLQFIVSSSESGTRLDQAIASGSKISRGKARKIIDVGGCYLNRKRIRKSSFTVKEGDKIQAFWRDQELEDLKVKRTLKLSAENILFEDSHFIAINKPAGLPSQGTKTQDVFHVVAQVKELLLKSTGKRSDLKLVHRLDRDTTGVMVLGKTKKAYKHLSTAFLDRLVNKEYRALCFGIPESKSWEQNEPIGKINPSQGRVYIDFDHGLKAKTKFSLLKANQEHQISLIDCQPITGRTHQIRAHLDYINYPVLGDRNYARDLLNQLDISLAEPAKEHQMLHARSLSFPRLRGEGSVTVEAPYPEAFEQLVSQLSFN